MKILLVLLTVVTVATTSWGADQGLPLGLSQGPNAPRYPFHEAYPLREEGKSSPLGHATLSVSPPQVEENQPLTVDALFTVDFEGVFYSPFFTPLVYAPAALAAYNANREYVVNLLPKPAPSRRGSGRYDWVGIPRGGCAGARLEVAAVLSPGTYYLQLIYYRAFYQWNFPTTGSPREAFDDFDAHFDERELFRSNIVRVEVLPHKQPEAK